MTEFVMSSKSIGLLAEAIESAHTATTMTTLFLKAEVDRYAPEYAANKLDRAVKLLENLRAHPNTEDARTGALELARLLLTQGKPKSVSFGPREPEKWWPALRDALAADGWEFDEEGERLLPTVPGVPMVPESTWIEDELNRRGWTTAKGHYRQTGGGCLRVRKLGKRELADPRFLRGARSDRWGCAARWWHSSCPASV